MASVLHSLHSVGPGCSPSRGFAECSECSRTEGNCVEECYDCARRLHDTPDISSCGCRLGLLSEGPFPGEIDPGLEYCRCPDGSQATFSTADTKMADRLCSRDRGRLTSSSALLGEMRPSTTSRGRTTSSGAALLGETRPPKMTVSLRQTDDVKMQRSQTLGRASLPYHHQDHHNHVGLSPSSEVQGRRPSKLDCILEGKPLIGCESTAERMTDDEDQSTFPLSVTG